MKALWKRFKDIEMNNTYKWTEIRFTLDRQEVVKIIEALEQTIEKMECEQKQ